jgi:hypothetical protein
MGGVVRGGGVCQCAPCENRAVMGFMELLIAKGYKPYGWGMPGKPIPPDSLMLDNGFFLFPRPSGYDQFSSMGQLMTIFVKDEDLSTQIRWGLAEDHDPPTLLHPRPRIVKVQSISDAQAALHPIAGKDMIAVLDKYGAEDVFESLFSGTVYEIDYDTREIKRRDRIPV